MEMLRVGRGFTAQWAVTLRDTDGLPLTDTYSGFEAVGLTVSAAGVGALTLVGSTVAWRDPTAPTLTLKIDDSDSEILPVGTLALSITITEDGEPFEAYRAALRIEPRPI